MKLMRLSTCVGRGAFVSLAATGTLCLAAVPAHSQSIEVISPANGATVRPNPEQVSDVRRWRVPIKLRLDDMDACDSYWGKIIDVTRPRGRRRATGTFDNPDEGYNRAPSISWPDYRWKLPLTVRWKAQVNCGTSVAETPVQTLTFVDDPLRYRIELKAWIPHAHVVDPERGTRKWSDLPVNCMMLPEDPAVRDLIVAESVFRGDNHVRYSGSYRVLAWTSFAWNGRRLEDVRDGGDYGMSHRDLVYYRVPDPSPLATCGPVASARASSRTGRRHERRFVELEIESPVPLAMIAPDIDATAKILVLGGRRPVFDVRYETDRFPSVALKIERDEAGAAPRSSVWMLNNAACVEARGSAGAARLLVRLNTTTTGAFTVASRDRSFHDRACLP